MFKTSIRTIDTIENRKAVRNIILYDSKEGNERLEPVVDVWFDYKYILAIVGPIAIPIKNSIAVMPKDIPIESFGVYSKRIFQLPILVNVNPIAIIARFSAINSSDGPVFFRGINGLACRGSISSVNSHEFTHSENLLKGFRMVLLCFDSTRYAGY